MWPKNARRLAPSEVAAADANARHNACRFQMTNRLMSTISRRSLILGGASAATLAVAVPLPGTAREPIGVEQFRALSARLTGASLTDLDATIAGKVLDGFMSMGRGPGLADLAAGAALNTGALAEDVIAAWYSGRFDTSAGPAAFDLTYALLWDALDFTKPPGLCGGDPGYWADAPQN